jgi:Calcineurin-like phosphoesterase
MSAFQAFTTGKGTGKRKSHAPAMGGASFVTQTTFKDPHFPFQPLPPPKDPAPFRYSLSRFLTDPDIQKIQDTGVLVFQTVGDTGDGRGRQQDFVAKMMSHDADISPDDKKPAFFYHLGDVVYFAGDIDKYGDNFYETYKDYPAFIVSIPGNHDCQPDDPQDGPVDPAKVSLDGWVQNFMSTTPGKLGSLKTGSNRTQMDLPNVYWTFNTPLATIIGLFSNVGETQGEIHQDQIDWFRGELAAADPNLALIVAVHHPPFSGDVEHSGSSEVYSVLADSFKAANRYPNLILSGHVHNYQRFTHLVDSAAGSVAVPCVVVGNGGYTNLGKLHKIKGAYPTAPLTVSNNLTLEQYDQDNFGFVRLEVSKTQIVGSYFSAPYTVSGAAVGTLLESFSVNLATREIKTL